MDKGTDKFSMPAQDLKSEDKENRLPLQPEKVDFLQGKSFHKRKNGFQETKKKPLTEQNVHRTNHSIELGSADSGQKSTICKPRAHTTNAVKGSLSIDHQKKDPLKSTENGGESLSGSQDRRSGNGCLLNDEGREVYIPLIRHVTDQESESGSEGAPCENNIPSIGDFGFFTEAKEGIRSQQHIQEIVTGALIILDGETATDTLNDESKDVGAFENGAESEIGLELRTEESAGKHDASEAGFPIAKSVEQREHDEAQSQTGSVNEPENRSHRVQDDEMKLETMANVKRESRSPVVIQSFPSANVTVMQPNAVSPSNAQPRSRTRSAGTVTATAAINYKTPNHRPQQRGAQSNSNSKGGEYSLSFQDAIKQHLQAAESAIIDLKAVFTPSPPVRTVISCKKKRKQAFDKRESNRRILGSKK